MRCHIGNNNLKVWGKAIQTLISTGDDGVHFQFTNNLVTITTFDASLTVSCSCSFEKEFFDFYDATTNTNGYIACRVPAKCLLKAFRSQRFLSKSVVSCQLSVQEKCDYLQIVLPTRSGPSVRYSINLTHETEALEIDCYPERLSNWIKVNPKFILGAVSNFGPTSKIADLTLKTLDSKILLKNCTTDVVKREGKIYTELSVNSVDFAEYTIREDSEITVPLREFKAFVSFAEGLKLDLSIHFQSSKDPVIIVIQNVLYKATLNLATKVLSDVNNSQTMSPATSGIISNVASQQQAVDPVVQIPAARLETSVRNGKNPVADSDTDSEEGILDQVCELNCSKSFDNSTAPSSSIGSERIHGKHGGNQLRKSKTVVTNGNEPETVSDVELACKVKAGMPKDPVPDSDSEVELIACKGKERDQLKTYGHLTQRRSTRPFVKRGSIIKENGTAKSKQASNSGITNDSKADGDSSSSVNFNGHEDFGLGDNPQSTYLNNVSQNFQPPKKRVKTFESMFPNISTREIPHIPGMDIILLPASDEEDC